MIRKIIVVMGVLLMHPLVGMEREHDGALRLLDHHVDLPEYDENFDLPDAFRVFTGHHRISFSEDDSRSVSTQFSRDGAPSYSECVSGCCECFPVMLERLWWWCKAPREVESAREGRLISLWPVQAHDDPLEIQAADGFVFLVPSAIASRYFPFFYQESSPEVPVSITFDAAWADAQSLYALLYSIRLAEHDQQSDKQVVNHYLDQLDLSRALCVLMLALAMRLKDGDEQYPVMPYLFKHTARRLNEKFNKEILKIEKYLLHYLPSLNQVKALLKRLSYSV